MYKHVPVVVVVAMSAKEQVIGANNDLLWDLPNDRAHFRDETRGKPVVMGRKTFESIIKILGKPLPKRPNIIVTRDESYAHKHPDVEITYSLEAGLEAALKYNPTEIHIGGGSQLYDIALPYVDEIRATIVHDEPIGDAHFPAFKNEFTATNTSVLQSENDVTYEWVTFMRTPDTPQ